MSVYENRFKEHQVHDNLQSVHDKIRKLISEATDQEAGTHLNRILSITVFTEKLLKNLDAVFVPKSTLDQLNKILNNINGDLNNYENSRDINIIANSNNRADNLLIHLQQVPKHETPQDLQNLSEMLSGLHTNIEDILKQVGSKRGKLENSMDQQISRIDQIKSKIEQQDQTIEKQKDRLDSAISRFESQFSEAEDRRRKEFDQQLNTIDNKFEELRKNKGDEIEAFLEKKRQDVTNTTNELKEKTDEVVEKLREKADTLYTSHKNEAEDTINFLEEKREEASKLLNIIGNIGFTGNYNKIAEQERSSANSWRKVSISFMLLGVLVIGSIVFNIAKSGFSWELLIVRFVITVTVLIPAFYAAKESRSHRENETKNRKMELELASIGPYLELLPEEKKTELKSSLTDKFFGQPETTVEEKDSVTKKSLLALLEKALTNPTKK